VAIWLTADTHFGQAGALGRFHRPFASLAAMDAALVENWNAVVAPEDEVWHLGDFAVKPTQARVEALLAVLHGTKHLVAGNNDIAETLEARGWADIRTYAEIVVDDVTLVLSHYAFRTWNGMYKGAWNLHGHSHGALKPLTRQVDVGVDAWDFRPIDLAMIRARRRRPSAP
jgi:calcineurin-like phosphoesterase family protein